MRSILFTTVIAVVAVYIGLYILVSTPYVQNEIKSRAEKELTSFLGGEVRIGSVDIFPFNEVRLKRVEFFTPAKERCISIGTLGAGIHLWTLLRHHKIEITYAEVLDLDGKVWQEKKDDPLNIAYIIDALSPKDKTKPPTRFDLKIRNIVIRRSALSFDRRWVKEYRTDTQTGERLFDPNHISLTDFRADLTLPKLKNDDFVVDMRRLGFKSFSGLAVEKVSFKASITNTGISLSDFLMVVGESEIGINDTQLSFPSFKEIVQSIESGEHSLKIEGKNVSPREFRFFSSILSGFSNRYDFTLAAYGNLDKVKLERFDLTEKGGGVKLSLNAELDNLRERSQLRVDLGAFNGSIPSEFYHQLTGLLRGKGGRDNKAIEILTRIDFLNFNLKGSYESSSGALLTEGDIESTLGGLNFGVDGYLRGSNSISGIYHVESSDFNLGRLLDNKKLGEISLNTHGDIEIKGKDFDAALIAEVDYIDYNGRRISNIVIDGSKEGQHIIGDLAVEDPVAELTMNADVMLAGSDSHYTLNGTIEKFYPSVVGILPNYAGYAARCEISGDVTGNNLDNIFGDVEVNDFSFADGNGDGFRLGNLIVSAWNNNPTIERENEEAVKSERGINLSTDFLRATITGDFKIAELLPGIKGIIAENVTSLVSHPKGVAQASGYADVKIRLLGEEKIPSFIKLPVKPLADVDVNGKIDLTEGSLECELTAPYLLQGSNKLICNTRLHASAQKGRGANIIANTIYPIKNDKAELEIAVNALQDNAHIDLGWRMLNNKTAIGNISLDGRMMKNAKTGKPDAHLSINPSSFSLGASEWKIDKSDIFYSDKSIDVNDLRIWHDNQFVEIKGRASAAPEDEIEVTLADIDLEYIFGILNINYVTFGGIATGELSASSVFTKNPIAQTKRLRVENFAYNDAVLGDAEIYSLWNNSEKEVEIHADIKEEGFGGAKVDGGVYVTRDSLSFEMKADKINIEFLKPFMSAFTSDVGGRASGDVKLFGTFKDIDLTGRAYADSIYMKVDYSNVYYHGRDSVILNPGRIEIPSFTLYDKYGNSGVFSGYVNHSYFHDPEFEFRINNADHLLCYDTNSQINPDWYGTIYASGKGVLRGRPGIVAMEMDMVTEPKSDFTFVLSETQTALDYNFLTFSDRRKEQMMETIDIEESFEEKFRKKQAEQITTPTNFVMDLRVTATPQAKMNLIMDPNAGDKITAFGGGPLQIHYDTESDEMTMYGKYTLSEGNYNFSLQELILRDFKIREGSSISFNGDPLAANIDIVAAYRVNTNLSDLDKSFSTDRDLNRTNVPVDALLKVRGDLQAPEISFDISLPTLTSDVERKVRSIISTEDLMSRQIIYLLALNRFYTPEYMGSTSNGGGELASVASSTISSQLSNIMGQLTDKFTLAPSFRSDKGDFSDMEVDVSLSSKLLNNRLLINGNFGYRDRSTSQTTFVGDFDIEYLLSRNGNLRLKAYNHFNDQNYYLKSSLTTQGIGVVYRKEFDNPFTWLRRRKKSMVSVSEETMDVEKDEEKEDKEK